jgi:hypothetical protein
MSISLAIPVLGVYPKEMKCQANIYTAMFIAALFTKTRRWEEKNL